MDHFNGTAGLCCYHACISMVEKAKEKCLVGNWINFTPIQYPLSIFRGFYTDNCVQINKCNLFAVCIYLLDWNICIHV